MHHLQDITGATYSCDPDSGAICYGEADADAFQTVSGVIHLSACGCPAETGCQCGQKIEPITTAAGSSGSRRTAYRTVYTPPAAPTKTPLAEVRAGVARVRREMAAEKGGRAVLRRVRNEAARDFEYLRQNPNPDGYSAALARLHGAEPELDIYRDGPVPQPYSIALGEIVLRRADGTPVRLPEGDEVPAPYTLALEAMRQRTQKDNDN